MNNMNWELTLRIASALVGIISLIKIFHDLFTSKKTSLQNEYNFVKIFLNDLTDAENNNKPLHPFALEKGYQALAGTDAVSSSEVKYILTLKDSAQCLRDFIFAKYLFERLNTDGDFKIKFRKKYSKLWVRNLNKTYYILGYVILAFISISPLVFMSFLNQTLSQMSTQLMITLPIFGFLSYISLNNWGKFIRGEHLYQNQKEYQKTKIITDKYSH